MTTETKTRTIKLNPLDILHYRLIAKYREYDYEIYSALVGQGTSLLAEIPVAIQEQLVKSDFLLRDKT